MQLLIYCSYCLIQHSRLVCVLSDVSYKQNIFTFRADNFCLQGTIHNPYSEHFILCIVLQVYSLVIRRLTSTSISNAGRASVPAGGITKSQAALTVQNVATGSNDELPAPVPPGCV